MVTYSTARPPLLPMSDGGCAVAVVDESTIIRVCCLLLFRLHLVASRNSTATRAKFSRCRTRTVHNILRQHHNLPLSLPHHTPQLQVESICAWIAGTEEAKRALESNNLIHVRNLTARFNTVGSPFASIGVHRQPTADCSPLLSDQAPSAPARPRLTQAPTASRRFRRTSASERIREAAQIFESAPFIDPPALRSSLLVDVRTPSEIDRDEAEARALEAYHTASGHLLSIPYAAQNNHSDILAPDYQPLKQEIRPNRYRGAKRHLRTTIMAGTDGKPQYIPPHMRPRQPQTPYIPPHLRNSLRNGELQPLQQIQSEREGGVSLNGGVATSGNVTVDEGVASNGGVTLSQYDQIPSATQTTAAPTSATATVAIITPASATAVEQAQLADSENNVQDQVHTAPRAMENQRGPRKQTNNHDKPKRKDKWATNKEIRERIQRDSAEPIGAWGSNGSEAGFNSNPGGDPQHDIKKLVDWNGNWLPGPTDWESRRSYHHRNFNEEMMRFVYDSVDQEAAVDVYSEPTFLQNPSGEVAPRVWASLHVEGTSLQEWWNNHVGSPLADPDSKAWWRAYTTQDSSLLVPYDVPEPTLDPADHEGQILHLHDLGSGTACEKLMERKNKRKADRERRHAVAREFTAATTPSVEIEVPPPPPKIKPAISLYIRPALAADVHQIAGIYNEYVTHSIRSPEVERMTPAALAQRIATETSDGMPWLVACQKGKKGGRGFTNGTDASILGFACASDYHSRNSMYGFTAEAEIYVHPNYMRQKVGSCLMDRLLYILDPSHYPQEGYQFIRTGPLSEHGGVRVIGSAIMNVPFNKKDPEDLKTVTKFLSKFGFRKEAELPNMGVKQEKNVSLAFFRYYTGNTIDPRSAVMS